MSEETRLKTVCTVCSNHCALENGQTGFCKVRYNKGGVITSNSYGKVTSIALDPIEKKPLYHFYPGSRILSIGGYGCNFSCPFCQNYEISMGGEREIREGALPVYLQSPAETVEKASALRERGNIGLAHTYNEPLINYEYVRDCSILAGEKGLKNVVVTNGSVSPAILKEILPYIDAFNIDLKGFTEEFYRMVHGKLEDVKQFIVTAAGTAHVEITTLVIPGLNDKEEEIGRMAEWIASVSPDIPLHLSRFFPRYRMTDREATEIGALLKLAKEARRYLKRVYVGNC